MILSKERWTRLDLLRRRCVLRCLRRNSFPVPVILNRLAVALCVFIFGIIKSPPFHLPSFTCLCSLLDRAMSTARIPERWF